MRSNSLRASESERSISSVALAIVSNSDSASNPWRTRSRFTSTALLKSRAMAAARSMRRRHSLSRTFIDAVNAAEATSSAAVMFASCSRNRAAAFWASIRCASRSGLATTASTCPCSTRSPGLASKSPMRPSAGASAATTMEPSINIPVPRTVSGIDPKNPQAVNVATTAPAPANSTHRRADAIGATRLMLSGLDAESTARSRKMWSSPSMESTVAS